MAVGGLALAKAVLAKANALVLVRAAQARMATVVERPGAALALRRVCRRREHDHRQEQGQQEESKELGHPTQAAASHGDRGRVDNEREMGSVGGRAAWLGKGSDGAEVGGCGVQLRSQEWMPLPPQLVRLAAAALL